jgi:hypothetical protein
MALLLKVAVAITHLDRQTLSVAIAATKVVSRRSRGEGLARDPSPDLVTRFIRGQRV